MWGTCGVCNVEKIEIEAECYIINTFKYLAQEIVTSIKSKEKTAKQPNIPWKKSFLGRLYNFIVK